jgi:hypothetical protein
MSTCSSSRLVIVCTERSLMPVAHSIQLPGTHSRPVLWARLYLFNLSCISEKRTSRSGLCFAPLTTKFYFYSRGCPPSVLVNKVWFHSTDLILCNVFYWVSVIRLLNDKPCFMFSSLRKEFDSHYFHQFQQNEHLPTSYPNSLITRKTTTYTDGDGSPGLGQAQRYGGVRLVSMIITISAW